MTGFIYIYMKALYAINCTYFLQKKFHKTKSYSHFGCAHKKTKHPSSQMESAEQWFILACILGKYDKNYQK